MKLKSRKNKLITKAIICYIYVIGIFPILTYSTEADKVQTLSDIKPPFTFTIKTTTPDGKPQPGVKIRCTHGRGEVFVDIIETSDANGIAKFNVTKANLALDKWFNFYVADENFTGNTGAAISPVDNSRDSVIEVLPVEDYQISVLNNDNRPIAGAKVWVLSDNPSFPIIQRGYFSARTSATTNAQGIAYIKFAQIETNVIVDAKGYASGFSRAIFLPKGEPFVIKLAKGCTISGRVVDTENKPIKNAEITAKKEDFFLNDWGGFLLEATTDDEGKFVLENATEGTYEIRSRLPISHDELYTKPVKVAIENKTPINGLTILAERETVLKGKYIKRENFNVANREILISIIFPEKNTWQIKSRSDGSFVISGIPENAQGNINFGQYVNHYTLLKIPNENQLFSINNYSISFNHLPKGTYDGLEVHFLLNGIATGRILDLTGNPMPEHVLFVNPSERYFKADDKGAYTAEIPPTEEVTIEVRDSSNKFIYKCEPFRIEEGQVIQKDIIVGKKSYKLVGNNLPDFAGIKIDFDRKKAENKRLLICFFDIEQRPSRSCILELSQKKSQLKEKGIELIAIQASKIELEYLDNWLKEYNISFTIGMLEKDEEQTKFNWGVKSLPWLILNNKEHVVIDEGFSINDLDSKIGN